MAQLFSLGGETHRMKHALEDLMHRRPVWEALSDLYLDTDTSLSRTWRVGILASSPYSIDELTEILASEVYPVCSSNLVSVAGEWAGFDPQWLESSILRHIQSSSYRWRRFSLGWLTLYLSWEWRQTKLGILEHRSQKHESHAA